MNFERKTFDGEILVHQSFDPEAYRKRLRQVRKLYGENQPQFAERMGIPFKTWNRFEKGYPIPRDIALILVAKVPGLSAEWLWLGERRFLTIDLAAKLDKIEAAEKALGPPQVGEPENLRIVQEFNPKPKRHSRSRRPSSSGGRSGKRG